MTAVPAPLCWTLLFFTCVAANQETITAQSGQIVTLPCRAPNNNITITVTDWSRADLESEYVLVYRDDNFIPDYQHPSFKDRVDLQDRQMKDGDVSLILKNVTSNDTGTYECRVVQRGTSGEPAALLKTKPICTFNLSVVDPPDSPRRVSEGGEEKDGSVGLIIGLSVLAAVLVVGAVVGIWIYKKPNQQQQPPIEMGDRKAAGDSENSE